MYRQFIASIFLALYLQPAWADPREVLLPAGAYTPLFSDGELKNIAVPSFYLDKYAVTNSDFLGFVKIHSKWRKSKISAIFADPSYLKHWKNDLNFSGKSNARSPVVFVSWFAAKAYCKALNKTLPTVGQWEYAARPEEYGPDTQSLDALKQDILEWYGKPTAKRIPHVGSAMKNIHGIYDLHGLIWEWTLDFNSAMTSGESRGDSALDRGLFCGAGAARSSDVKDYAGFMRYAFRSSLNANYTVGNLGFRCARSLVK